MGKRNSQKEKINEIEEMLKNSRMMKKNGRMPFKRFKKMINSLMDVKNLLFHQDMVFAFKILFIEDYYPRLKQNHKDFFLNQYNETRFGYITYYFGDLEKFLKEKGKPDTINGFFMDLQNKKLHVELTEKEQENLDDFSKKMLSRIKKILKINTI